MSNNTDISVLIATHNRAAMLRETLESMVRLDREGLSVEFVVVDNNSSDHTKQVIESFTERLPVRYLFEPRPGKNCALNKALDEVPLGKLFVFTDDDVEPRENWLQTIVSISNKWLEYNVFGGKIYVIWPTVQIPEWAQTPWIKSSCFAEHNYAESECPYTLDRYPFGANFWVRSDLLANGRRFDESIAWHPKNRILATETTFLQQLSEEGHSMLYSPDAVIGHRISPEQLSLTYLIKRAFQWGRGIAHARPLCRRALLNEHPVLWRLVRIGAIARLAFPLAISLVALALKKPEKAMQTMQWIGYNVESLNIAKKG